MEERAEMEDTTAWDDALAEPEIADGLRAWASGGYSTEAAVELLIAHGVWLRRKAFRQQAMWVSRGDEFAADDGELLCGIDWDAAAAVASTSPASASEHRILAFAIALVAGVDHPVDLGDAVTGLDVTNTALVLQAIAHTAGVHERHASISVDGHFDG